MLAGQHADVKGRRGIGITDLTHHLQTIHSWHHPVQNGQGGGVKVTEKLSGANTVFDRPHSVTASSQNPFQPQSGDAIVFGDNDIHSSSCRMFLGKQSSPFNLGRLHSFLIGTEGKSFKPGNGNRRRMCSAS
ncbi:MAG: hypothetical protein ACRD2O_10570 [Terriglobia bacterium]